MANLPHDNGARVNIYAEDEAYQALVTARAYLHQAKANVPYHHGVRVFADRALDEITIAVELRAGELYAEERGKLAESLEAES